MRTTSFTTTGDDLTSEPVLNVHNGLPSRRFTAWTTPPRSPIYTTSVPTKGDDSPIRLPVVYFQRSAPVAMSSAIRSPSPPPTYTTPFAIAADDSTTSPAV